MGKLKQVIEHYGHELDSSNKLCCPFHNENTPSLVYYEDSETFYCFGCGEGSDVINWICNEEGWDSNSGEFRKAVKKYEDITGDVETYASPKTIEELEQERIKMALPFNKEVLAELKAKCTFDSGGYRGIRSDVSKQFGVMFTKNADGELHEVYYPTSKDSVGGKLNLTGFKVRQLPKTFNKHYGETGGGVELFGQWKASSNDSDTLIVCAGENDALAAQQMLNDNTAKYNTSKNTNFKASPCVSGTVGENGLAKQLRANYDFLDTFKKIIYIRDMDVVGLSTIEDVLEAVPRGKLFLMELSEKDPHDMLIKGKQSEFINSYFKARKYTPTGVVGSSGLMDSVKERALEPRIPLPPFMHRLQKDMAGGIPLGVIVNCGGGSGIGKSTIIDEIIYYWLFNSPYKIGILSLESDEAEYGTKLLSRHVGTKISLFDNVQDKVDFLNRKDITDKSDELFKESDGSDRFYLLEEDDGNVEDIKKSIMKMIVQMACKFIITDPIQDLIASLTDAQQNEFMSWQKNVSKSYGVSFFNINHTRKEPNSSDLKEGKFLLDYVSEHDYHGSSALYKSGAANILMARNKEAQCEVEKNTTYVKASKIRWTGITSRCSGKYYYHNQTHKLYDYDEYWTPERLREKDNQINREKSNSF